MTRSCEIPAGTAAAIRQICGDRDLPVSTFVETAWALVLTAFSQEEDVVLASTAGGRVADAVPIRVRIRPEQPVVELARELGAEYSKSGGAAGDGIDAPRVIVREDPEIAVSLTFEADRVRPEAVERMAGLLEEVLEAMAARPESTVAALPSLPACDVRTLAGFNDTRVSIPAFTAMHEDFERQADLTPDAMALVYRGQSLTYRELDRRANIVAGQLVTLGVGPDAMVGIFIDRSVEMVVGLMAILKAGGAYVPMDPAYPSRRIAAMLEDTGARVVLTLDGLRGALPPTDAVVVALDALGPERGTGRVSRRVEPHHLAYVIFTSGSTGRPKGVQVEHRHAANFFAAMDNALGTTPGVWLALTSISFDISVVEIFWTLARGFTVVLQEWSERTPGSHDPGTDYTTLAQIHRHRVTHLQCTPSLLGLLAIDDDTMAALSSLRVLVLGGEPIPTTLVDRLGPTFRGTWLNGYGPTETTVYSSVSVVRPGTPITIGRPVANTQIHIVDRQLRPVPVGARGELVIGGDGVTRGYLARPELTAERFVTDPWGPAGSRLYRTGDVARWLPSGEIEFLGRLDNQIKIRGYRIELGEVETVLSEHPSVRESVVVARDSAAGDARLVAYVVARPDGEVSEAGATPADWEAIWNETYRDAPAGDGLHNTAGWKSSFTGEAIPNDQMSEWIDTTAERIICLARDANSRPRVLEIGCGTGLLLFPLAPYAEHYVGVDFSAAALSHVRSQLGLNRIHNVTLELLRADELARLEAPGPFDAIIINSVIQYFPDVEYLTGVLKAAYARLAPGGVLFVGDVRSLPHLDVFHTAIELARADEQTSTADLETRIRRRTAVEGELVVDPRFFEVLAHDLEDAVLGRAELKAGRSHNEMTCFRYDAVLRKRGGRFVEWPRAPLVEAPQACSLDALRALLADEPAALRVTGVPNARVAADVCAAEMLKNGTAGATVAELRARIASRPGPLDPEDVRGLHPSYEVKLAFTPDRPDRMDVTLLHRARFAPVAMAQPTPAPLGPLASYANRPARRITTGSALIPELRQHIRQRLPEYMVPGAFVLLPALPLTPNGKIDRAALPTRPRLSAAFAAPADDIERELAALWSALLGVADVGVNDDFFELGGQSLVAVRLFQQMAKKYDVDLPLASLFHAPTVAKCATLLRATLEARGGELLAPAESFQFLVKVKQGDDRLPFFCVHGAGGNVLNFRDLARAMDPGQPFYGLQASGTDGVRPPHPTIEAMAAAYVDEVRQQQPHGPYLLGGYSGGGVVAFEMAQLISAAGEQIGLLAFIDTFHPQMPVRSPSVLTRLERLRREHLAFFKGAIERRRAMVVQTKAARAIEEHLARREPIPLGLRDTYLTMHFDRASHEYHPRPWGGRATLFRAQEVDPCFQEGGPAYGWDRSVLGGVEIVMVPGDHDTVLLGANAELLVKPLNRAIDRAVQAWKIGKTKKVAPAAAPAKSRPAATAPAPWIVNSRTPRLPLGLVALLVDWMPLLF